MHFCPIFVSHYEAGWVKSFRYNVVFLMVSMATRVLVLFLWVLYFLGQEAPATSGSTHLINLDNHRWRADAKNLAKAWAKQSSWLPAQVLTELDAWQANYHLVLLTTRLLDLVVKTVGSIFYGNKSRLAKVTFFAAKTLLSNTWLILASLAQWNKHIKKLVYIWNTEK
jgi:hypothetical protein